MDELFVKIVPEKKDFIKSIQLKDSLKPKPKYEKNLWDAENFTSINPKLPIYPRATGFKDFGLQTKRPFAFILELNESRFNTINRFP